MASPIWWTWIWANSGSCWWTGKPGVLQFMELQESDMTEQLNWTDFLIMLAAKSCLALRNSVYGISAGKNTGVGCHYLLQGIFPTQGSNPGLLPCRKILYHQSHQGSIKHCIIYILYSKWIAKVLFSVYHICSVRTSTSTITITRWKIKEKSFTFHVQKTKYPKSSGETCILCTLYNLCLHL